MIRSCAKLATAVGLIGAGVAAAPSYAADEKPRLVVLTDIGNEPDDAESFVRLLLYTNQIDVEGLVATTSTWQRGRVQPQLLIERIDAYRQVLGNLRRHAAGYPDPAALRAVVRSGSGVYGMQGVGAGKDTPGSRRIIEVVDRPDPRPVHISAWGGVADLAQALWTVHATRTPAQVKAFVAKLRVYSISDQDDAGAWARRNFPDLFWIASVHGWSQYGMAAWTGISADVNRPERWPGGDLVTNEWLEANVRRGPLGRMYPPHKFIMEGDTPSFLWLIPNGLNQPDRIEWGGWGGRYLPVYEGAGHRADAQDAFADATGKIWLGNQATVYRWRSAFQHDFAARIAWTLSGDIAAANHQPEVVLNGSAGLGVVRLKVKAGQTVSLSAAGTRDRDGDTLNYRWWQYAEPSGAPGYTVPRVEIAGANTTRASFVVKPFKTNAENTPPLREPLAYHIILEVTDSGKPALTSYRRAIVEVAP